MINCLDPSLLSAELKIINQNISDRTNESSLKWKYRENKDWIEIENYWHKMITETEICAKQMGTESPKVQGETFQANVVDLLRITIFNARYLGGKNLPDGTIFLRSTGIEKSELIPLEIKSNKSGFVLLQKHEGQIRKYLKAFKNTYVTDTYKISRLIVLGFDFETTNQKEIEVKTKLESDFDVKIIQFPLVSLVHLVNLYFKNKIAYVDNDIISDFLRVSYIQKNHVDKLVNDLDELTKQKDKDSCEKIKKILQSSGY